MTNPSTRTHLLAVMTPVNPTMENVETKALAQVNERPGVIPIHRLMIPVNERR
jgi:hypothetical protein